MSKPTIHLELTVEQACCIRKAVDLLNRLRLGQIEELTRVWEDRYRDHPRQWDARDALRGMCDMIKSLMYPELHYNASYGVGSPQLTKDDQRLYEIYKVLDHALWLCQKEPRPTFVVSADDPYLLRFSGDAKIPFEVVPHEPT